MTRRVLHRTSSSGVGPIGRAAAAGILLVCLVLAADALAASAPAAFTVRSTLTGKKVLPHRVHWYAFPSLPPAQIREVDFFIDNKLSWVEHNAPYDYGFNDNYLVTTWLKPGLHQFTVRAVTADGRRAAKTTSSARTLPATPPPAPLAGRWTRTLSPAQTHGQPSGTWILEISKIGWWIKVPGPGPGANLIDVGYLAPNLLELRGGIWNMPHPENNPTEGNGWCDEPFQPVRYHWKTTATTLALSLAGPRRCDGQSTIIAGNWKRP